MKNIKNRKIFILILVAFLVVSGIFLVLQERIVAKQNATHEIAGQDTSSPYIKYTNSRYGFTLDLPKSWIGYTITDGPIISGSGAGKGFLVTIRNPKWTKENPTMDIPIQVFTITQWQEWENNNFETYPTVAPIGPTERGRNKKFVFATSPRYNYGFLPGFEEVENILKTLKGF